jgi:TrkA domain protein
VTRLPLGSTDRWVRPAITLALLDLDRRTATTSCCSPRNRIDEHEEGSGMDIQETALPGVGLRHDFTTRGGRQLGVVSYRTGRRDLLLFDSDDPDACQEVIGLTDEEADALADLLGAARLTGHLAELQQQIEGLAISWLTIQERSPYADGTIADTQARSRTGVSIAAVLRGRTAFPAPEPSFGFQPGDTAVVVGTPAGVRALARLLDG